MLALTASCFLGCFAEVNAQQNPALPDTTQPKTIVNAVPVGQAAQPKPEEPKGLSRAKTATLLSTALPGLGQIYNGRVWKVPVIYASGGGLAYLAIFNHDQYKCFRDAADYLSEQPTQPVSIEVCGKRYSPQGVRSSRDFYRRNRDLSLIFIGITYALNIVDANVDAHMKEFDVSEDLSLNVNPAAVPTHVGYTPGINLTFNFRK